MNRFQLLAAKWRREAAFAGWFCGGIGVLAVFASIMAAIQSNHGFNASSAGAGFAIMGMFFIAVAYMHLVSRLAELAEACGKSEASPKVTNPDRSANGLESGSVSSSP